MNKKILIIVAVVVLGGSVLVAVMMRNNSPEEGNTINTIPANEAPLEGGQIPATAESDKVVPPLQVKEEVITGTTPAEDPEITNVKTTASLFVSYYGTYSSSNPTAQLSLLRTMTTPSFAMSLSNVQPTGDDVRLTAKPLGVTILSRDAQTATVEVLTQRVKTVKGISEKPYSQKLKVTMINSGGIWEVNAATWNETTF